MSFPTKTLKQIQTMVDSPKGSYDDYIIVDVPEPLVSTVDARAIEDAELYITSYIEGYKDALRYAGVKAETVKIAFLTDQSFTVKETFKVKEG